jgi:hypothetical protein
MTKKHFDAMAALVQQIRDGNWTPDAPAWAEPRDNGRFDYQNTINPFDRAVQTAEAFIILANQFGGRFDEQRFLRACGLVED